MSVTIYKSDLDYLVETSLRSSNVLNNQKCAYPTRHNNDILVNIIKAILMQLNEEPSLVLKVFLYPIFIIDIKLKAR